MANSDVQTELSHVISAIRHHVEIPIGISNRHIHLSQKDFDLLFPDEDVEILKELYQPGFYAAKQTVTICGPKGQLERVRLLVPLRNQTQVELSKTDARTLGMTAPIRLSGELSEATEVTICSPKSSITRNAAIIAKRHIHMNFTDAVLLGFQTGDVAKVEIKTDGRTTVYDDVIIRPSKGAKLEMHLDTDEANAANCSMNTTARFID